MIDEHDIHLWNNVLKYLTTYILFSCFDFDSIIFSWTAKLNWEAECCHAINLLIYK